MKRISLIDYGTGNLHSLVRALESGGALVSIHADPQHALDANAVVLPGAGTFRMASAQLTQAADAMRSALHAGLPCLGIGLGMQLLFESGEGNGAGLGLLGGRVRRLHARRLPHMGWNDIAMMDDPLFEGLRHMVAYYANSTVVEPTDASDVIAWSQYGAERFPAAIRHDRMWGTQFLPEKSGAPGLRLIRNFVQQVTA